MLLAIILILPKDSRTPPWKKEAAPPSLERIIFSLQGHLPKNINPIFSGILELKLCFLPGIQCQLLQDEQNIHWSKFSHYCRRLTHVFSYRQFDTMLQLQSLSTALSSLLLARLKTISMSYKLRSYVH